MRTAVLTVIELVGLGCLVVGMAAAWRPLGWLMLGAALLVVAWRASQ